MADLKRKGLFNQKRSVSVGVYPLTEAEVLDTAIVAALPVNVIVTNVYTNVKTASGTASSSIVVKVGGTTIANNVAVASTGLKTTTTPGYFATGGDVTVAAGATAPATGTLDVEVIIEYAELSKTLGEYTN